jgi:hypothetical protein
MMRVIYMVLGAVLALLLTTTAWAGACGCGKKSCKPDCGCKVEQTCKPDCGCGAKKHKCGGDVQLLPDFGGGGGDFLPGPDCCGRAQYTLCCDRAEYTCDKPKCQEPPKCKCPESNCGCKVKCKRKGCGCQKCCDQRQTAKHQVYD